MSIYQKTIKEILGKQGKAEFDPRHIEGYMRLSYSTLDHLSRKQFEDEIAICILCIKEDGPDNAEMLAQSYGL